MSTRNDVLAEFTRGTVTRYFDTDAMADEIGRLRERVRELEAQLVSQPYTLASGEPVAWDLYNETGRYDLTDSLAMAREWEKTAGNVAYPLYRHPARPSAAGVRVTEAMVEAAARAFYGAFYDGDRLWVRCPDDIRVWWMDAGRDAITAALTHPTTPTRGSDE